MKDRVIFKNENEFIAETLEGMKEYLMKPLESDKDHKGHGLDKVVEDGLPRVSIQIWIKKQMYQKTAFKSF